MLYLPQIIDKQQFLNICQEGAVIQRGRRGPRVLETPEGNIIKIFWPRKYFPRNILRPSSAKRFIENSLKLREAGLHCVDVTQWYYYPCLKVDVIMYPKLPGKDIREIIHNDMLTEIAAFIANLHDHGIFFRGIHLGNLLQLEPAKIALIDVTDCKVYKHSLGFLKRYRNLRHLLENQEDHQAFKQFGIENFIDSYLDKANINLLVKKLLKNFLLQKFKKSGACED